AARSDVEEVGLLRLHCRRAAQLRMKMPIFIDREARSSPVTSREGPGTNTASGFIDPSTIANLTLRLRDVTPTTPLSTLVAVPECLVSDQPLGQTHATYTEGNAMTNKPSASTNAQERLHGNHVWSRRPRFNFAVEQLVRASSFLVRSIPADRSFLFTLKTFFVDRSSSL